MADWSKRDKSIIALAKINQANAIIDNIKDSELGNIAESINTLSINYKLLYNGVQELINDLSALDLNYSSLADSNTSNTEQIQSINQSITTLNQNMNNTETSISNINQQLQSINQSITTLNQNMNNTETSISNINQQLQSINQSITTLNQKVAILENK